MVWSTVEVVNTASLLFAGIDEVPDDLGTVSLTWRTSFAISDNPISTVANPLSKEAAVPEDLKSTATVAF